MRFSFSFTWICAVGLISLIYAVNNPITAVRVRSATSFVTLERVVPADVVRWRNGIVLDAVPLIWLKFHTIWTATHSTKVGSWKTEVAAVSIWQHVTSAIEGCQKDHREEVSRVLDCFITAHVLSWPRRSFTSYRHSKLQSPGPTALKCTSKHFPESSVFLWINLLLWRSAV